ncbi:hypothetical protein [Edaphovirga cremea]|jgi:hypothetical protein|uniref:hypothetical protein n=1 Tax=Edaphovirga cremea TaxID=2267246 RepID=UPI000DEEAEDD|nr:hypothetical protein [Edaphovirga cremea]
MSKGKVLEESRQLKRLHAATRKQSHWYKWIAFIAALDCILVIFYDQDMRNIVFSGGVTLVCLYLYLKERNKARGYRREYDQKFGREKENI